MTNYEVATYNINTCEWGNGSHDIFATAECQSGYGDVVNSGAIATGHGVSAFVPVTFNNLVTRISFSQPSFDPSLGQTQQVSAFFPLNSDWTLNVVDVYSNVVQTATGSGNSMLYNWDGAANGTNLPNGVYYYYITAATNGLANEVVSSGSGGGSVPSPSLVSSETSQMWAVAPDSESVVPLALYPSGFDTNGFTIFSATSSEVDALISMVSSSPETTATVSSGNASPNGIGDPGYITPLPNPQPAPPSPQRPPNNPFKGLVGSFGVFYDTYTGNGASGYSLAPLDNGLHIGQHISMNNYSAGSTLHYAPLPQYKAEANNFISQMQHWGWNNSLLKVDDQLNINDLKGSSSPLNNVNLAIFMSHGMYGAGSSPIDYAANGCQQMYYPVTSGGSAQYLRLSEMNLGGGGTNGLKWMALLSCNSLQHDNWANMQSLGVQPYNGNLHLLLGVDTVNYTSASILWYWAKYMNYGTSTNANSASPLPIRDAWYQAAQQAYKGGHYANTIKFVVAGDTACEEDYLQTNSAPGGVWFIDSPVQVWP